MDDRRESHGSHEGHDSNDVTRDLTAVRDVLARIRSRQKEHGKLLEILMGLNDDLTTDLDVLTTAVTGLASAYTAQASVIADLKAQLAAGPPGLTAEQGATIAARFAAVNKQIADALAPAGVTVPPGETPVG